MATIMNCQDHLHRQSDPKLMSRRWFLEQCGVGLGGMALGQLFGEAGYAAAGAATPTPTAHGVNPLAPRLPHFAAQGEAGDLPVHGRRPEPSRAL